MASEILESERRSCGFTLIEMLVALLLLSLVFVFLTGGMRLVMDVDRKEGAADADITRTQIFLTNLLAQARPAVVRDPQSVRGESVTFTGSPTQMEFLSVAPNAFSPGGLYNIRIIFEQASKQLSILWGLYRPSGVTDYDRMVLLDHVPYAEFSYFGKLQHQTGWRSSWEHALGLPRLVRIRLTFSNQELAWPDLVVSPKITAHRPVALGGPP